MVAMFGFALPSDEEPAAPRPTREPEPDNEDDGSDIESVATAAEALPRTARKLTPVRQAATAASTPVDPLVPGRDLRRRAADRERLRLATCRIEAELGPANGVLVSPTQIVAVFGWDGERGLGSHFTASFPNSTAVAIVEGTEERVTTTRGRGAPALTLLKLSEPIGDIAPMTLGRAARGPWDGYGSPTWLPADAHFMTGTVVDPEGLDPWGLPALEITSTRARSFETHLGLVGMPVAQDGHVVGLLTGVDPNRAGESWRGRASRAEDVIRDFLPGHALHEPGVEQSGQQPPDFEGLFAPRDAVSLLRFAASTPSPSDRLDVPRVVDRLARAEPLLSLPRLHVPSFALGAQILVDVGLSMESFWEDQQELVGRVTNALRGVADVRYVGEDPQAGAGRSRRRGSWRPYELPRPGTPVIALTDLGCGFPPRADTAQAWLALAGRLRRRQSRLVAFAPVRLSRVNPLLRRAVDLVVWDRAARRRNLSRLTRRSDG